MEQAHSAASPLNVPLRSEIGCYYGALIDSSPRDRHAHTSFLEQTQSSRGQCAETSSVSATSSVGNAPDIQGDSVGAGPPNTPIANYKNASNEDLIGAARSSDGRAFAELSGRCTDSVHRTVFRILRNREDTEDVVQEALFKAYKHLDRFRGTCGFSTWLTRIAINSALMLLRRRRLLHQLSFDQPAEDDQTWGAWEFPDLSPNAEQVYARQQTGDLLSNAAKKLPVTVRRVVEQYHAEGLSLQETANTLGITLAAAKSRLMRARHTMRTKLRQKCISMADTYY